MEIGTHLKTVKFTFFVLVYFEPKKCAYLIMLFLPLNGHYKIQKYLTLSWFSIKYEKKLTSRTIKENFHSSLGCSNGQIV